MQVQVQNNPVTQVRMKQYLPALTALRGIAALWVVLFHLDVIIYYRELGTLLPQQWSGLIAKGYLWVDLFFILSGFIICHIYGEQLSGNKRLNIITGYLKARFFRIYPLHLFTILLLLPVVMLTATFLPAVIDSSWQLYFDWQALLSNVLLTNAMNQYTYLSWNIVSWSIGAEWWAYIYAIGLLYFISNQRLILTVIMTMIAFTGLIFLVYWHPKHNLDITFDFGFLRCLFEFSLGVVSYQLYQRNLGNKLLSQDWGLQLTLVAILAIFHWQLNDLLTIPLFMTLVLCAAYNQGRVLRMMSGGVWQYLGRTSYSIYLMHGVWFMVFWFSLPLVAQAWQIESFSITQIILYVVTFIALTIISAHYSYRYVEVPCRYLFSKKNAVKTTHPLAEIAE